MLFILRKIRRSFFLPGKVRTYMAYAAGEIVLIVVGILIAVEIGDRNQVRLERLEEQQILLSLKFEFEKQAEQLKHRLIRGQRLDSHMWRFLSFIKDEEIQLSTTELDEGLYATMSGGSWDPANTILDTIVNSGKLDIIQNSDLKLRLATWNSQVNEVLDGEIIARSYLTNTLWPLLGSKGLPLARGRGTLIPEYSELVPETIARENYNSIRGEQELINMISLKHFLNRTTTNTMDTAIREAEEIISLIDKHIH